MYSFILLRFVFLQFSQKGIRHLSFLIMINFFVSLLAENYLHSQRFELYYLNFIWDKVTLYRKPELS